MQSALAMIAFLVLALAALANSQLTATNLRHGSRELFPQSSSLSFAAPSFATHSFAAPSLHAVPLLPTVAFRAPVRSFAPAAHPFVQDSVFTPQGFAGPQIAVVQRSHQLDDRGQFTSSFSQTDGSSVEESGELHPTNDHLDNVIVKKGSYRYTSPEGVPVEIHYTADEYGYHPQGSAIPVPVSHQAPSFQ